MEPLFVSIEEAQRVLCLGRNTIFNMIAEGRLDTVKVGRRRLVKVASMRALAEGAGQ
jgi:excisionase family DNA binding protein